MKNEGQGLWLRFKKVVFLTLPPLVLLLLLIAGGTSGLLNPKVMGLTFIVLLIVSAFVSYRILISNKTTPIEKDKKVKVEKKSLLWSLIWWLLLLTLIGSAIWYGFYQIDLKQQRARATPQFAIFSWSLPNDVLVNQKKRNSDPLNALVLRNDAEVMSFTVSFIGQNGLPEYAHYYWLKREEFGKWYQTNPTGSGRWNLKPNEADKSYYTGVLFDDANNFHHLALRMY